MQSVPSETGSNTWMPHSLPHYWSESAIRCFIHLLFYTSALISPWKLYVAATKGSFYYCCAITTTTKNNLTWWHFITLIFLFCPCLCLCLSLSVFLSVCFCHLHPSHFVILRLPFFFSFSSFPLIFELQKKFFCHSPWMNPTIFCFHNNSIHSSFSDVCNLSIDHSSPLDFRFCSCWLREVPQPE